MAIQQVETATIVGTITGTGNATVTITSRDLSGSPMAVSVAVTSGDSASTVGGAIRTALAASLPIAALFSVSGSGASVVLTANYPRANDNTLNIAIANGTCTGLTAAPTSTDTTAGESYCALTDLRNLDVINVSGTSHDDLLAKTINGVARKFDDYTGRRFWMASETRYYTARDPYCIKVDDIGSASGITIELDLNGDGTYEFTLASTDYNLAPYNALSYGWPYTEIEKTPIGQYPFSTVRRGNKVTAPFGWSHTPEQVRLACILQCNRIWNRFKTPLGMAGASAVGTINLSIPKLDPDVREMLDQYRMMT